MPKSGNKSIVIYKLSQGQKLEVPIRKDSIWLTQKQISELFQTDRTVITRHINNIIRTGELKVESNVQKMHYSHSDRPVKTYNLDFIISVGYRVNSLRATQFRIWATKVLRQHILKGFTVNKSRLMDTGIDELERAVNLVRQTMGQNLLKSAEAKGILQVITDYTHSWVLLQKYDEGHLQLAGRTKPHYELTYQLALSAIAKLKTDLNARRSAPRYFGLERDDHGLERILGAINQTYGGKDVYPTVEEKSAHLLYFVIKDHPLIDGNKRSGALLFLHYLAQNGRLFKRSGERRLDDNALVALTLLIAASDPADKDLLIKLITQLLVNG